MTSIENTLNSYPRVSLTRLPTPLHPLLHLSTRLELSVSIKRDDLTDLVLMAQTEGILLDPVYSGKVASGFLAHHAAGRWPLGSQVLLLHSGGTPALFAYHGEIKAHLSKRGVYAEEE